jgi:fructokinase
VRIGIDIGSTKIESAVIAANNDIRVQRRVPKPKRDYSEIIDANFDLVSSIEQEIDHSRPFGFGFLGPILPVIRLVKNTYNSPFNDHPFYRDLADWFGWPVRLIKDANCFALSEAKGGAVAGSHILFGAILETGCGSSIVVNEELLTGANNISGDGGPNSLPWPTMDELPNLECGCAKRGCIEIFLSGTGLKRLQAAFWMIAKGIVAQVESGDAQADHSLTLYKNQLACALSSIINPVDPDVIILGSRLSNVAQLYENVPKFWSNWIFSNQVIMLLQPPKFSDLSGVIGAAWLWAEGE